MSAHQTLKIQTTAERYSKLQKKVDKQAAEITRLMREVRALKDDIADLKDQRDALALSAKKGLTDAN